MQANDVFSFFNLKDLHAHEIWGDLVFDTYRVVF